MPLRPASPKVRALQWLAQREHSRQELRDKLLRLMSRPAANLISAAEPDAEGPPVDATEACPTDVAGEVDALLAWLEARGYLSQQRFVESRVHARQARFGNLRIRQELQQHGLQLDADTRQALQASEEQRARDLWQRKFGQAPSDATQRVLQLRFLAGRGFSTDVVRRVVLGAGRAVGGREANLDDAEFSD